ncbi:jacalin-like lectin, partial [Streptomyces sp. NPDC020597]
FSWSRNPDFQLSDQFGGPHGDYYNDIDAVPAGARVTTVALRAGARVDQVSLTVAGGAGLTHGGNGGTAASLTLGGDEYLTTAYLCQAQKDGHTRIFYTRFTTNLGRSLSGGTTTSDCVTRTAPTGWQIAGFHGRSGNEIDKLGFVYTRR